MVRVRLDSSTVVSRTDRAAGVLLGVALGDAMGAAFGGRVDVSADDLAAQEHSPGDLVHTDVTMLALVVAEHVADRGVDRLDENELARGFVRAWRAEPWRGYGVGTPRLFGLLQAGVPWADAARAFVDVSDARGNGAAVRAAAVALSASSPERAADLARRCARITHAQRHGQLGAVALAVAVHLVLGGDPAGPVRADRFLREVGRLVPSRTWRDKFDQAAGLVGQVDPDRAGRVLGRDSSALGSVPTALLAFLTHVDAPDEAVRFAVRAGGGSSAIPAMTGALAGARHGASGLPRGWLRRLPIGRRLAAVGQRFG